MSRMKKRRDYRLYWVDLIRRSAFGKKVDKHAAWASSQSPSHLKQTSYGQPLVLSCIQIRCQIALLGPFFFRVCRFSFQFIPKTTERNRKRGKKERARWHLAFFDSRAHARSDAGGVIAVLFLQDKATTIINSAASPGRRI